MAELDYAFIADHAQIQGGKLSAIGASFTHVTVPSTEGFFVMSVAGRVRLQVGEPEPELGIRVRAPEGMFEITSSSQLEAGPDAKPYNGKVGVLFAAGMAVPIIAGLFEIYVSLDGRDVRRLAFDLQIAD